MSAVIYDRKGVLREKWDTDTNTYTQYNEFGVVTETRPFNAEELAKFAIDVIIDRRFSNKAALLTKLRSAFSVNTTFLGRANPTTAQTLAQVQALTRQMNGVMKQLGGLLGADDLLDDQNGT